jgi:hypothetical protein
MSWANHLSVVVIKDKMSAELAGATGDKFARQASRMIISMQIMSKKTTTGPIKLIINGLLFLCLLRPGIMHPPDNLIYDFSTPDAVNRAG